MDSFNLIMNLKMRNNINKIKGLHHALGMIILVFNNNKRNLKMMSMNY